MIETKDGREPAPRIRGVLRTDLIRDLAIGELTRERLAEKYGRSLPAINQFAARNSDEIRLAKQAMVANPDDEYAGLAFARKMDRLADAYQDLADINELLQDGSLTPTQRKGYLNLKSKLRHEVAEERGELPSRIAIESDKPLLRYELVGVSMDEVFSESGQQRRSTSRVPDQSEPETSPAPEPEPGGPTSFPVAPEPEPSAAPLSEDRPTPEDRAYVRWLNS